LFGNAGKIQTWGHGDTDMETLKHGDMEMEKWRRGDMRTWRHGHGVLTFKKKNQT
jgi:hypothetical protein